MNAERLFSGDGIREVVRPKTQLIEVGRQACYRHVPHHTEMQVVQVVSALPPAGAGDPGSELLESASQNKTKR
jgi:hypothetical protein